MAPSYFLHKLLSCEQTISQKVPTNRRRLHLLSAHEIHRRTAKQKASTSFPTCKRLTEVEDPTSPKIPCFANLQNETPAKIHAQRHLLASSVIAVEDQPRQVLVKICNSQCLRKFFHHPNFVHDVMCFLEEPLIV